MTTTAEPTAAIASRYPCPTGCKHAEDFADHELAMQGDRPVLQHEVDFGSFVFGTVLHDLVTSEVVEDRVTFCDLDGGQFAPGTAQGLRELAVRIQQAADWLEAHQ